MCGFVSVVTRAPLGDTLDVRDFDRNVLRHRGPDSAGELVLTHAYVRHWRLSIVDLSDHSSQPYGHGESWLIYNGEIYNYEELGGSLSLPVNSDTAVLHGLCERGLEREHLKRARGFYSYLYVTENGRLISGGRDPFGKKPLFYSVDNAAGIAVFASEEKAVVDCLEHSAIDYSSIAQYLLYKHVFRGHTYFSNVQQLAPGASFRFDVRAWSLSIDYDWDEYYEKPAAEVFSLDAGASGVRSEERGLDEQVFERLRDSFELRLPREVSACVALSGGVDSSVIAHCAAEERALRHISQFVTIGFEEPGSDESARASEIASALSISAKHAVVRFPQHELLACLRRCVGHASAPLEHPHYLSYYVLSEYSSRLAKVLITGEGADELFMGYEHYLTPGASFAFREYLQAAEENSFVRSPPSERPFDFIRRDARVGTLRARAVSSPMSSREYELKTHLLSLLDRNDKMGMANSVEIRAPFLDRRMLALSLTLSDADLVVNGAPKYPLRQIFANCFPHMKPQGRKIGFRVPFDEMFLDSGRTGEMRGHCETATRALDRECGLKLASLDSISPRLGWSLVNIGLFLEAHS